MTQIPAQKPIFIVGCSRAGTTVVYKTFSKSNAIGSLDSETYDFWVDMHPLSNKNWDTHGLDAIDASTADRDYVSRYFYSWTGPPRFIDKNNENMLDIPHNAFFEIRLYKCKDSLNREKIERVLAEVEATACAMGYEL